MVIILHIGLDWDYFYLKNIENTEQLIFTHLFILDLAVASSAVWSIQGGIFWT